VCVPGSLDKGAIFRCRDNKLERGTSRRPNFFVFRSIEVSKEPRQGFLDALKPLEQSVCQFEHCKTCFLSTFEQLIIMIHWKLDQEM
jgi:hypothetical protein